MLLLGSLSVCKKTPDKEKRASSSLNLTYCDQFSLSWLLYLGARVHSHER